MTLEYDEVNARNFVETELARTSTAGIEKGEEIYLTLIGERFVDGVVLLYTSSSNDFRGLGVEYLKKIWSILESSDAPEGDGLHAFSNGVRMAMYSQIGSPLPKTSLKESNDLDQSLVLTSSALTNEIIYLSCDETDKKDHEITLLKMLAMCLVYDDSRVNCLARGVYAGLRDRGFI